MRLDDSAGLCVIIVVDDLVRRCIGGEVTIQNVYYVLSLM